MIENGAYSEISEKKYITHKFYLMQNFRVFDFWEKKYWSCFREWPKWKICKGVIFANAQISNFWGIYFCEFAQSLQISWKFVLQKFLPLK